MKKIVVRLVAALSLVMALGTATAADSVKTFETFGYEDLKTLVAESKGKVVMVNFFATWCPPCREEIPGLMRIRKSYGMDKLVLIGASLDEDEDALQKYVTKTKINYPVKKSGMDLARAAGVTGIPHMLVFDPKGELAANQSGYIPEEALREFLNKQLEAK